MVENMKPWQRGVPLVLRDYAALFKRIYVNGGDIPRIHLVIDVAADDKLRRIICDAAGLPHDPPSKAALVGFGLA